MSLGSWFAEKREQVDLLRKFQGAKSALDREAKMGDGFDIGTTVKKGLSALAQGAVAVLIAALVGYLADADAVKLALQRGGLSDVLVAALVPAIVAGARVVGNWWKHRDDTARDAAARNAVEATIEARKA